MIEMRYLFQVTIGPRTVIHPKARILAEAGPIFIGEGNLIGLLPKKTIPCDENEQYMKILKYKLNRGAVRDHQQGRGGFI